MTAHVSISHKISHFIGRFLPEKRIFVRSDDETRFVRLTPGSQLVAIAGTTAFIAWSIVATSILMMDTIGSGSVRDQALREQLLYEQRLNQLSDERDLRAAEAESAHKRFNTALDEISQMQLSLLASQERKREMEKGIVAIQKSLRAAMAERNEAVQEMATLQAELSAPETANLAQQNAELADTVDVLASTLGELSGERDSMAQAKADAEQHAAELELDQKLVDERNDRIFSQLEDAVSLSLSPLDGMFKQVGMSTDRVLDAIRAGHSGQGGPLMPLTFSTKSAEPDPDSLRANLILEKLDEMNLYRIAVEKIPFDFPLKTAYRPTSGFGPRWGRMHEGQDLAGAYGSPVYATADGVVIHAGWSSGYGRLIKIRHEFGIETRYGHLAQIRVKVGQRVSRGDRIGDMGNSGHSTGTHLHYEVRVGGKAVNPMTYIKAGRNVF